jgi:extracellular factor (EF) 3-hydroxypalmitic acid methyl ester biosynthesis protein
MQQNGHTVISADADTVVTCQSNQGLDIRADVLRLTRYLAVFEISDPNCVLRTSEVLGKFQIKLGDRVLYSGRAIVASLVNTGTFVVCQATLSEGWVDVQAVTAASIGQLRGGFDDFVTHWQKFYKIQPAYKVIVADIQSFLMELRLWLGQIELGIRAPGAAGPLELEQEVALELGQSTTPAITTLFEGFERAAAQIDEDLKPAHSAFVKRQLHSLLLSSPFLLRTFQKPLGYPGDYEMVNMIVRDPREGDSLYAKIINVWFLHQPPAEAHRNRIGFLADHLSEVTMQAMAAGRKARILSLGCGPAGEVQRFLREKHFSDHAEFTLLDFSEETLAHTRSVIEKIKHDHHRVATCHFVKKSVLQIFKEAGARAKDARGQYDFVYCAGLFDYFSDSFCHRLSEILYDWVMPGGLFVTTNVDSSNPRRLTMEYIMEWHLIYRNGAELAALKPKAVADGDYNVTSDVTGVNIYFETRKPKS